MEQQETCYWTGFSGTNYKYFIYPLRTRFKPGQSGNYIYARQDASGLWVPSYIGEGELDESIGFRHPQWPCLRARKVTHVHVHLQRNPQSRFTEENDLLENYTQVWFPRGCRQRETTQNLADSQRLSQPVGHTN